MIVLKFSQPYIKKFVKLYGFQICTCFSVALEVVSFKQFCDFSLNKSCKTYLGPMLPPVGRNWQLISPHWNGIKRTQNLCVNKVSKFFLESSLSWLLNVIKKFMSVGYDCNKISSCDCSKGLKWWCVFANKPAYWTK